MGVEVSRLSHLKGWSVGETDGGTAGSEGSNSYIHISHLPPRWYVDEMVEFVYSY